jgi:hypothetical protein
MLSPLRGLSALGMKVGTSWMSGAIFKSGSFNHTANQWTDTSINANHASLVASRCGTAKVGTILTFASALSGSLGDWTLTKQGTATPVLALDKITFSGGGTIYDITITNGTLTYKYPCCEAFDAGNAFYNYYAGKTVYDVSGNANHLTMTVSTVTEWTANTQNTFHYNLRYGGGRQSKELLTNPGFEGTYTAGIAPGGWDCNGITKTEETSTVHGGSKAQRFTANTGAGLSIYLPLVKGMYYYFSAWVYVVSGGVRIAMDNIVAPVGGNTNTLCTTTGQWTKIYYQGTATATGSTWPTILASTNGSDIIVDDASFYCIGASIGVPGLMAGTNDVLGRALAVQPSMLNYCETKLNFPATADLIASDVNSYLFTAGVANNVSMIDFPFALTNMGYDDTIYFNETTCQLNIFKANLGSKLRSLLSSWAKPVYKTYKHYKEWFPSDPLVSIYPFDVNQSHRLGLRAGRYLHYSSDNGVTWNAGVDINSDVSTAMYTVTSLGTIIKFTVNKVYRSTNQGTSFTEITPKDLAGNNISIHSPANASYPGEYIRPFSMICDVYSTGANMLVWGNYGNTSTGANPTQLFFSTDDGAHITMFYQFGQNTARTDNGTSTGGTGGTLLGNASNAHVCRHVHNIAYNSYNGKFYVMTGDLPTEVNVIEFSYNSGTGLWSEANYLVASGTQRFRMCGCAFDATNIYWGTDCDDPVQGIFKSPLTGFADTANHTKLRTIDAEVFAFEKIGNALVYTYVDHALVGSYIVAASNDLGNTWNDVDCNDISFYYGGTKLAPAGLRKDNHNNFHLRLDRQQNRGGFYLNVAQ